LVALVGTRPKPGFARAFQRSAAAQGPIGAGPSAHAAAENAASGNGGGEYLAGGAAAISAAAVSAAKAANVQLSRELNWVFGSKAQHGWAIYIPLICKEIGTDADIGSEEFALAVSRWQRRNGLAPVGSVDLETWGAMVRDFQSQRIRDHAYPAPEQLVTAPASDFYDPERLPELRQVQKDAYGAYRRMLAAADADLHLSGRRAGGGEGVESVQYLRIISAFRSREYQDNLRRQSPKSGRAGLAINSPHFSGRALDLYVGGEPVNTRDDNRLLQTGTPVYRWLVKNAAKFGFKPYFYEPWHWEYCPECGR
jgi:hypothetical protein